MTMKDLFSQQPQLCYIDFPNWKWPHDNPRRPRNNDDYWVPNTQPYQPYDPYKPATSNRSSPDLSELLKNLRREPEPFTQTKDGLKFRLELAGFAKEDLSVTINDKALIVKSLNTKNPYSKGFVIPNAENYNLANPTAQMSNGLLEISFAAKKRRSSGD